jgi:hypothetical protein
MVQVLEPQESGPSGGLRLRENAPPCNVNYDQRFAGFELIETAFSAGLILEESVMYCA